MENLLCDEAWLSNPGTPDHISHEREQCCPLKGYGADSFCTTKEDSEQALVICLEKELSYMPEPGYLHYLQSNSLVQSARFRAFQWLIKNCTRLNFSMETVFNAANYLDRFLSISQQCHEWKQWMVELLSVACLSIASKFNETDIPSLDELQMEDLEHSFQSSTVQQMELMLLQALKWRLSCTTTYSYTELITSNIIHFKSNYLQNDLINHVNKTLFRAILDFKLLNYPPSVIAVSAIWCSLEELIPSSYELHLTNVMNLIKQDHEVEDDIIKCRRIMKAWVVDDGDHHPLLYPSSPVTVLLMDRPIDDINDCHLDLSLFKMPPAATNVVGIPAADQSSGSTSNKRKRSEDVGSRVN